MTAALDIFAFLGGAPGTALAGTLIAFSIATLTTPVGVSGAVFLVPAQVSLLGAPSAAVTPTNLLYNLVALPGALLRFHRERLLTGPLTRLLLLGTLPGMVAGAAIRAELLTGSRAFLLLIAVVLAPLGAWLAMARRPAPAPPPTVSRNRLILALSLAVGVIGGIYGIGGGSILSPVLVGLGYPVLEVAPAALAATFSTSLAGLATFALLNLGGAGAAPDWQLGLALGLGGLGGSYLGARLQPRLPETALRRALGLLSFCLGMGYALSATSAF